jgi:hypothetical protein
MDDLDQIRQLAGITQNIGRLQEYRGVGTVKTDGSNMSVTANEKIQYQNNNNIQPGTPEWFQLWFSKPYLTGETPW